MTTGVDLIRERARLLPEEPGVYVYRDEAGEVLYIGKAKSLRKRVGSYARPDRALERKTAELVVRVAEIDVTITGTATGVDMANPMQPITKPFEIKVSCPSLAWIRPRCACDGAPPPSDCPRPVRLR